MTIARKIGYAFAVAAVAALPFGAQAAKDSVNIAMTLEPPGLDPRDNAAAAIGQIALYNIYENLTRSIARVDSLVEEIRSNPKKYFSFSIF